MRSEELPLILPLLVGLSVMLRVVPCSRSQTIAVVGTKQMFRTFYIKHAAAAHDGEKCFRRPPTLRQVVLAAIEINVDNGVVLYSSRKWFECVD